MSVASTYIDRFNSIKSHGLKIWNHAGFQKYFRNTGWMFFGRFFALGVSFFVGAYIARYLGPANYGLMNYAISFVGLFGFLASFGIDGIISREIIKDHNKKDEFIGTGFFIKLFGSFITIIFTFTSAIFITRDPFTLILIFLFSLSFMPQAFNVIETYFQSQVLAKNIVRAQIISSLISTLLKILIIFLNKGVFWLIFIFFIETCLMALFLIISFIKNGHHIKNWIFNKKIAISILRDSWPLMFSGMAFGIYTKIDFIMIKNILGNEATGLYAVVIKLSEIWYFIPSIICTSIFPIIVNSHGKNIQNKRLSSIYKMILVLAIVIIIPVSFLSEKIILSLFGKEFISASLPLSIYIFSNISIFIYMVIGQILLIENQTRITLYLNAVGAITNIILNIILIPKFGIVGAAIATLISYNILLLSMLLFKKVRPQFFILLKSILPKSWLNKK